VLADTPSMSNGDRARLFLDRLFPAAMGCFVLLQAFQVRRDAPVLAVVAVILALLLLALAILGSAWRAFLRR